jgi:hypothetical protein
VAANSGATRVYDGTTAVAANMLKVTNAINGDVVTLGGNARLASADAGAQALSRTSGLTVSNPNYTAEEGAVSGSVSISQAPLTVTASNASKVYGQTPTLSNFTSSGLVEGQSIGSATLSSSGAAVTAGVTGSPYSIVVSEATGGNFTPGNYSIMYVNGALTVTPLAVAVAANSGATRVYDGTTAVAANMLNVTNAINGDVVTLDGNASLSNADVGVRELSSNNGLRLSNPSYTLVGGAVGGSVRVTLSDNVIPNVASQVPSGGNAPSLSLPVQGGSANAMASRSADSVANVVNALPQLSLVFGANTALTVISSPNATEQTQVVSLTQVRSMLQKPGAASQDGTVLASSDMAPDVRVPVSRNSLAEIVNGGVRLPDGVEQQLFVVPAN